MSRQDLETWPLRHLKFEAVEERLVLSADPLPALAMHGLLIGAVQDEAVGYDHHTVDLQQAAEPAPLLGTVNATTGVDYVHNNYGFTGAGQTVAVIDSGIAWDHYNLGQGYGANYRVVGGWDFAENDSNPYDDAPSGFHGTHVAGIIGSDHATRTGVAPAADLVALRVFNDAGQGNFAWVESALQWVIANRNSFENPITTVNMSLGVPAMNSESIPDWAMLEDELASLNSLGVFVAVSAGNDFAQFSAQGLSYPAVSQWVVPVASANDAGTALSGFSQRDDRVLVAPGETIVSTVPDALFSFNGVPNDWASASGTSMASPYVAGASVLVREAYWSIGVTSVSQDMIYDALFDTADLIYDPITAASYHFIDVQAAVDSILSQAEATPPPPTDLGTVDVLQVSQASVAGEAWYRVTAAHSGYFTVRALSPGQQNVDVQIYSDAQQLIGDGYNAAGFGRADAQVQAGQSLLVRVAGDSPQTDLTLTNLVSVDGGNVTVYGTSGNDWFGFTAGAKHSIVAGGIAYAIAAAPNQNISFVGGGGYNTLQFVGASGNEMANLYIGSGTITGQGFAISATQFNRFALVSGGGNDVVRMWGTAGNDVLTTSRSAVQFSGQGFSRAAWGYNDVTVFGNAGFDQATMSDSAGDDLFWASPTWAQMRGNGYSHVAAGFERVAASATLGNDRASLNDSAADDTLTTALGYGQLVGPGFELDAHQFDQVIAWANAGYDQAFIYDSGAPNYYSSQPTHVSLWNPTFYVYAARFEQATPYAASLPSQASSHSMAFSESLMPADLAFEETLADGSEALKLSARDQARTAFFDALAARLSTKRYDNLAVQTKSNAPLAPVQRHSSLASSVSTRHDDAVAAQQCEPAQAEARPASAMAKQQRIAGSDDPYAPLDDLAARELAALDFLYFSLSEGL